MSGFLRGAISVVTGGGSGIGKGVAKMMAQQGARVAICDLSLESAKNTRKGNNNNIFLFGFIIHHF